MRSTRARLIELLADGRFHSGRELGEAIGVSRGAVWKQVRGLEDLGLDVFRVPGRGYRLARPLELLDRARILSAMPSHARSCLARLEVFASIDSTNEHLAASGEREVAACLAEHQSAGRGRRGRDWVSPFGSNLYLSLAWPFENLPPDFPALGLAMGVAARRALLGLGFDAIQLKWPNDLYANAAKLGGILLEMRGEPPGRCRVIAGIGINVAMPERAASGVDQAWTDLATVAGGAPVSRSALAAAVLHRWVEAFAEFERYGFAGFLEEWRGADLLAGREVEVADGREQLTGIARGVASDGTLEVETVAGLRRVVAGDASLRALVREAE